MTPWLAPARNRFLLALLCAAATPLLSGCSPRPDAEPEVQDPVARARADSIRLDSLLQRRRAYEAERARLCEDLYKRQDARHSNVVSWKYDQGVDGCYVIYRHDPPKTEAECDSMYPPEQTSFFEQRILCHDGLYRTRF